MERRVRAAVALEKGRPRPDGLTRWLLAGAGAVTALSAFALISFVVADEPGPAPAPPPPAAFSPPYGSYYAPAK